VKYYIKSIIIELLHCLQGIVLCSGTHAPNRALLWFRAVNNLPWPPHLFRTVFSRFNTKVSIKK